MCTWRNDTQVFWRLVAQHRKALCSSRVVDSFLILKKSQSGTSRQFQPRANLLSRGDRDSTRGTVKKTCGGATQCGDHTKAAVQAAASQYSKAWGVPHSPGCLLGVQDLRVHLLLCPQHPHPAALVRELFERQPWETWAAGRAGECSQLSGHDRVATGG